MKNSAKTTYLICLMIGLSLSCVSLCLMMKKAIELATTPGLIYGVVMSLLGLVVIWSLCRILALVFDTISTPQYNGIK